MERSARYWLRSRAALAALGVLLLLVGAVLVWRAFDGGDAPVGPVLTDMAGNPAVLDPDGLSAAQRQQQHAQPAGRGRFVVPSVGLDVPLGSLDEVAGQVTPPGLTSAYQIANRGVSVAEAATGTVYVVMHALHGGGVAPGNYLFDIDTGRARVQRGSLIEAGGASYRVTRWFGVAKSQLPDDQRVWADTPRRLVVITCLPASGLPAYVPAADNLVVVARLARP